MMMEAIDLYRHRFEPSDQLDRPYLMLGFNAFVADSDEEAQLLATSVQQAFVALRTGQPVQLPPPRPGFAETLPFGARAILRSVLSCSAVGTPDTARRQVEEFVSRTNAEELIVTSQIYDPEARKRSFRLLAEVVLRREGV
jgi:alkanesulfonate monooxygenase SsuD/methylene tetrahydromethanopterin reductase-like flavin-dependent oxidoreductase (luciferase family)